MLGGGDFLLCSGFPSDRAGCPFRKFHPAWVRVVRQNHRNIRADACDPALARDVRRRHIQVAARTLDAIRRALEDAGVKFLNAGKSGGAGVRLRE
jgi:hypothetical protein